MSKELITILITIITTLLTTTHSATCEINPNCFQGCSDSICIYDPSKNPFYNSSIILANSSTYNGPYCCSGCNLGYFLWNDNITCSSVCNVISARQQYGNPLTRKCNPQCPQLYYGDPTTTKCVTKCPQGYWISLQLNGGLCVTKCPSTITKYYYLVNRTCLGSCPQGNYTYINQNDQTMCAPQCLQGWFMYDVEMSCVIQCPGQYYGDNIITKKCMTNCPLNTYKMKSTKRCQSTCYGVERYGDDITGYCVEKCNISIVQQRNQFQQLTQQAVYYFGDNLTSKCVTQCPANSYGHKQILVCVEQCFQPYPIRNYQSNTCQPVVIKSILTPSQIAIISSTIVGGLIMLVVVAFLVYKFYLKKRLVRKAWTYNVLGDLHFSV